MEKEKIENLVLFSLNECCKNSGIQIDINMDTPLIGSNRIFDSLGLVNFIIDTETLFLDENIEISLTSESAMSSRISPFRSVRSLCKFIENQLGVKDE